MAHPQYNHLPPQSQHPPPVQTQNLHLQQPHGAFSPPSSYQQSPTGMSPTLSNAAHAAKRQRLSPNPQSPAPFHSPYSNPALPPSPYATSPQNTGYLSHPASPATNQPPSFHQPQPFQYPNHANQPPAQGSMPPPKMPYSKAQDAELEKANARDLDVNNISDVLTGSGIDLRAEEDNLLQNYGNRGYGTSFNSQTSGSAGSPQGSFNNWTQQANHGAYQGTGPLSQAVTQEQHQTEFIRKHEQAARILNESAQQPLTDPFLTANVLRHRIAKRAYENGVQVNVEGLFDKIPERNPRDVTRVTQTGPNGEQIVGLAAASLLNQTAPLVDVLSLLSLAAEERIRGLVEDAFAMSQGRQHTSNGVIPPQMLDVAEVRKGAESTMVVPPNVLRTPWEAPDRAVSPTTTALKQPPNAARLPTPPSEAPPAPQQTFRNINYVATVLKRKIVEDEKFEKERLRKRQRRIQGTSGASADATPIPMPLPDKLTKKDRDQLKKQDQTGDVLHRKANETASMALGSKKKYSWMTGGGGGGGVGSGASTPRPAATASASGTATPAGPVVEKALIGKKREYGADIERSDVGARIQIRDLVHVLEKDGKEKKSLTAMLARMKNADRDERRPEFERRTTAAGR